MGFFGLTNFVWRGRTYYNHNALLHTYPGMDGLKTGYTRASGYNLAASAVRNGRRLVAVVLGGATSGARNREMVRLLDEGFAIAASVDNVAAERQPTAGESGSAAGTALKTGRISPRPNESWLKGSAGLREGANYTVPARSFSPVEGWLRRRRDGTARTVPSLRGGEVSVVPLGSGKRS
jgi:D-alanyl-D-alanine carboxypeptidase